MTLNVVAFVDTLITSATQFRVELIVHRYPQEVNNSLAGFQRSLAAHPFIRYSSVAIIGTLIPCSLATLMALS